MEIKTPDLQQVAVSARKNDHATQSRAAVEATTPISGDKLTVSEQAQQTIQYPTQAAKSQQQSPIVEFDQALQLAQSIKVQIQQNPQEGLQALSGAQRGLTATLLSNAPPPSVQIDAGQAQELAQELSAQMHSKPAQALHAQATNAAAEKSEPF